MDTGRERIQFALGGISQTFEWIHITSRGRPFAAEVSLNAVTIEGRTYLQAIVRNVAKRKKSDDQLRKFSECLLSFGTDPVKNINLLTGLCGEIFGATCALYNRIVGTQLCAVGMWNTPDDYVPVSDPHGHICYDVINNNNAEVVVVENLPSTDYFHTDPNVAKYKLRTYVGKVVSFSGEPAGSLCAVFQHDFHPDAADKYFISLIASAIGVEEARKDALDRLLENAADLQESNIAKDKFFSIIAHDLKSPFNAIMGFSDILTAEWNDFSEEERQHFIWNINSSAKNTFRLLENLLEWAMTQTGKLSYHPVPVDLSVIANEIIIIFREQAEKKQVRLYTAVNFGTIVSADENMVRTIFRNLVSNAIKFTEPGGHVRIFSEEVLSGQPQQKMMEVSVLDSGVGIEAHVLPLLFRIDEKVRSLGTAQEKGTGLGLLLCRELIEKNRGTIHAENGPEKGSRFYFTLPAGE
jgi:signal transduction histidine kinase